MIGLIKNLILLNIVLPVIPVSLFKYMLVAKTNKLISSMNLFLSKPSGQLHSRRAELQSIVEKLGYCVAVIKNLGKGNIELPDKNLDETVLTEGNSTEILVSVVVPIYNVELYLKECLDSILSQSLKSIEIICINDGSTDESLDIVNSYAKDDARIIVIDRRNKGLGATRNEGLNMARGEYVFFMDSDDKLELNALEYMYSEASKSSLDVIYCDGTSFYESKQLEEDFPLYKTMYIRPKEFTKTTDGLTLFRNLVRNKSFTSQVCLHLCKRDYLLQNELFFPEGVLFEDVDFSLRCMLKASRVGHRKKQFFLRRVRASSIMTGIGKQTSRQFIDYFKCYSYMLDFLEGIKLDRRSQTAVLAHLWTYLFFVSQHFHTMEKHSSEQQL